MEKSRRVLCQALPLLFTSMAWADSETLSSFAKPFDELPVHESGANISRAILNGVTHEGGYLEVHETTLAPGSMPHPPHHHEHEELFLLSKGTVAVTINGKTTQLNAGSAAFVHSNEVHGVRNTGNEPAQYFVVAIGKEA
ncbi:cupin domain-containing protein [Paracidobacterium acidisoli]|uniref:Cupin domain-containing protein n=1 Tax=Paracidobacterium acidisoli TaxID=2303751 RepID=A0A372ITR6_9BACT|nr:cupin domain-containing protein [Paracidobacterium acidisoli]MBT9329709.1 cupin domain-containing protein [Paracidobacterium acidisoli]